MSEKYPPVGHPLQKLAARLTELLDEDHWAECEVLLLEAWNTRRDSKPYKWKTYEDWWGVFGKIFDYDTEEEVSLRGIFNAARERKE